MRFAWPLRRFLAAVNAFAHVVPVMVLKSAGVLMVLAVAYA
jgi:hypothetical protein